MNQDKDVLIAKINVAAEIIRECINCEEFSVEDEEVYKVARNFLIAQFRVEKVENPVS